MNEIDAERDQATGGQSSKTAVSPEAYDAMALAEEEGWPDMCLERFVRDAGNGTTNIAPCDHHASPSHGLKKT